MTEPARMLRCINEGLNGAIMNQTSGFTSSHLGFRGDAFKLCTLKSVSICLIDIILRGPKSKIGFEFTS